MMYYIPISDRAILLSLLPMLSLSAGEFIILIMRKKNLSKNFSDIDWNRKSFNLALMILGILGLFSGMIMFLGSSITFGLPWNASDSQMKFLRATMGANAYFDKSIAFIIEYAVLLQGASFAGAMLSIVYAGYIPGPNKFLICLPVIGTMLFDLGWGGRSNTFFTILILITGFFLIPKLRQYSDVLRKRQFKNAFLSLLAGILLMLAIHSIAKTGVEAKTLNIGGIEIPLSISQLIDYHAGTLISFDKTLDNNQLTWGRMSFNGIELWLRFIRIIPNSFEAPQQLIDWERESINIIDDQTWLRTLNTYSWLRYLYSDFDIIGLIMIPFVIGIISGRSAISWVSRSNRKINAFIFLISSYCAILASPTIMIFRDVRFVFALILLYFSAIYINKKSKYKNLNRKAIHYPERQIMTMYQTSPSK